MNYKKIEELFVDLILEIIAPNIEREKERNDSFSIIKEIIIKKLYSKLPDYFIYILPYGSFPAKTYLKNADIDITIFFELKSSKKIIIDIPGDFINRAFYLIKDTLEKYNKDNSCELFSDIKIIAADVRLLKFKIGSVSVDISVNNFSGMYKILFIDFIERQLGNQFNKNNLFFDNSYSSNKINIFRRTLLLIKAWCFYEGNLMGSNIGLMANYTLEILVIYIFNMHYEYIFNEFDAFEKFFEFMEEINLEKNVISLFGVISNLSFHQKLSAFNSDIFEEENLSVNQPFWFFENKYKDIKDKSEESDVIENLNKINNFKPLLKIDEVKGFINQINKIIGNIYLKKEGKVINVTNYDKIVNILDPLNNHNNLGKSINFHSYSKMKKIIKYMNKKLKKIQKVRRKGNPFLYINSLLNLFEITLSNSFIHLFIKSVSNPRIICNSKYLKHKAYEDAKFIIDKEKIKKFNASFSNKEIKDDDNDNNNIYKKTDYLDIEDLDDFVEEKENDEYIKKEPEEEDKYVEKEEEEDEDNDEYEEEKSLKNKNEIIDEDSEYFDKNINTNEDNIIFPILINNEIITKLFELCENKRKNIEYNNLLIQQSNEYSIKLSKFLKLHNLLS
jgi:hypothetical protein